MDKNYKINGEDGFLRFEFEDSITLIKAESVYGINLYSIFDRDSGQNAYRVDISYANACFQNTFSTKEAAKQFLDTVLFKMYNE